MARRQSLLYRTKGTGSTFRLVGTRLPKEEVSTWERGVFRGKKISVLTTMILTRKGMVDHLKGVGMISCGDGSAAYMRVTGTARGTKDFGENVTGRISYSQNCSGHFRPLRNVRATFRTIVDVKGFRTSVWRTT